MLQTVTTLPTRALFGTSSKLDNSVIMFEYYLLHYFCPTFFNNNNNRYLVRALMHERLAAGGVHNLSIATDGCHFVDVTIAYGADNTGYVSYSDSLNWDGGKHVEMTIR
jgi:hypothetical protein